MTDSTEEYLPTEVGRGTFTIAPGLEIEVINLDNGQRLITETSMERFLEWLGSSHEA